MSHSSRRYNKEYSTRSTGSRHSDDSHISPSTAPSSPYSSNTRPSTHHAGAERPIYSDDYEVSPTTSIYARSSTETYHSSQESLEEIFEEPESYEPDYKLPEYRGQSYEQVRPSNPSDFADFFPSTRRLYVRHDDTTPDGNLNLRVETESRKKGTVQLFHLRMYDIKKREFSLRRYERNSGREVCHTNRKNEQQSSPDKRPGLTRSMSNAFASIRRPEVKRRDSGFSTHSHRSKLHVKRQDSGYGSDDEIFEFDDKPTTPTQASSDTMKLEFSNYAQVEVKYRGAKSHKRYEFEYWGHNYTWKRVSKKEGSGKGVSFHLYREDGDHAIAYIVPELRSSSQIRKEELAGGWVPPCSMWISDPSILEALTDVADVIVATGLITLVDDCVERRFHSRPKHTRNVSLPGTKFEVEFVTPKVMYENMFKRRNSTASSKATEPRPSPLRYASPVKAY